ncbi:MAG: dihydroorotate dehydrogenase electron transfer subunit [Symbiobacteriaceae bacterium]|nr:dihydroorotate dehydrogenase electron transfer subunit [Symbiobacteriaceae bacterium]
MQVQAVVTYQEEIARGIWRMQALAPAMVLFMQPGQFVHLLPHDLTLSSDPLLRRPLSLAAFNSDKGTFEVIYQVVGRGTRLLSLYTVGDSLDTMGPLGNPFPLPAKTQKRIAMVAGGIGLPPLYPLARLLMERGYDLFLFHGLREKKLAIMQRDFEQIGLPIRHYTNDGSLGMPGLVTTKLHEELRELGVDLVYACGPKGMLVALQQILREAGIPGWFSLENHLACGVGACLGCTVRIIQDGNWRYALLCQDGPAFASEEVLF